MSNFLSIVAEDTEELLSAGMYGTGAVIRLQTAATEGGAYADVSGTGSTPTIPLTAGVRTYTGYDPAGASTSWYRTRYENVGATRASEWSDPFQASAGPAMLCTDGQVKARLWPSGQTPDAGDDPLINELIVQVSAWIETYTGRWFTPHDGVTMVLDTSGGYVLRVPRGVRSVSSMGINVQGHQPDEGGTYGTLSAATVMLRPASVDRPDGWPATEIRLSRATSSVFANVENGATVTGDFGFAATPPEIQAVAIDGVVAAYQMRKHGASGVFGADASTGVPWWQFTRTSWQTLNMYRHFGIA